MPYLRASVPMRIRIPLKLRHGIGQIATATIGTAGSGLPVYDSTGRYLGGSALMDFFCGGIVGQTFSPATCSVPTPAQITAAQTAELATTSAPAAAQAAAIAAGNAAVAADAAANPANYQAQIAAANHPELAAMLGPSFVQALFPVDVTDPNNPTPATPWLLIALIVIGVSIGGSFLWGKR